MPWHSNQFFHASEIATSINSARTLFNNTNSDSYHSEEKIFIPGTSVKILVVFKGKEHYIPGVIRFFRVTGKDQDIVVAICVGGDIYTEVSFKDSNALILDLGRKNIFENEVSVDKERLNGLA